MPYKPNKFCKNCEFFKHNIYHDDYEKMSCLHPELATESISPVTGTAYPLVPYAIIARNNKDLCGLEGRWYKDRSDYALRMKLLGEEEVERVRARNPVSTPSRKLYKTKMEDLI